MSGSTRYRINAPEVVAETLDGEALIVHLGTGAYYSIRGSGEAIWGLLLLGATVDEACRSAALQFETKAEAIEGDVARFVDELAAEGLIVAQEMTAPAIDSDFLLEARGPWETPALEKFTDMEDLLALDPVHDVDAAVGWPNVKSEAASR